MRAAYRNWHEILSAEFFGPSHANASTVLYVDAEVEQDLAERHGMEIGLVQAVVDELNWIDSEGHLLGRIQQECKRWASKGKAGPPPSLPLLAVSVLAAARMESSDGMRRTNFYGRWMQLFGEDQNSYRGSKLRNAFPDVAKMWEELDVWLHDTCGLYGTSTISTDDVYWKIGYPISQALIRGADRQILTRFFAATRLRPYNLNEVTGRELLRRLRAWTAGHDRHLSPLLIAELAGAADNTEPLVASLLKRLADDWDGTLHEPEREHRRRALGLRLVAADRGRRLEWLADAVGDLPVTEVSLAGGRTFALRRAYGDVYDGLESLQPSHQQLSQGVRLEGEALVLEWVPQEVVLLRMHPHIGEWFSTEYFEPGQEHWILAADTAVREMRAVLEGLGGRTVREAAAPVLGWKLFKGVRAVNGTAFARTLDRGSSHVHVLEPQVRRDADLVGGLRIAPEYRAASGLAGHFLRGGAPDLLLPASDSPDGRVAVVLDGETERLRADPRVPLPLCIIPLDEGPHRVGTEQSSKTFTLHDGLHEALPPGTGSLGYRCDSGSAHPELSAVDEQTSAVCGAYAPDSIRLPRTELIRHLVVEAMLLGSDGSAHKVKPQTTPAWMASRLPEEALTPCLEVEVPPGCAWLVYRTATRWSVRQLLPSADIPAPAPSDDDYVWVHAVLSAADRSRALAWLEYVAAAQAIAGRWRA